MNSARAVQRAAADALRSIAIEHLETRRLFATIVVTSADDTVAPDGAVTLREAILSTNSQTDVNADVTATRTGDYQVPSGNDTIDFNVPGSGAHTIAISITFPSITSPVIIDGYTQPGASANTLAVGDNAVLQIEVTGKNPGVFGLTLEADGITIRGLALNRFIQAADSGGIAIRSKSAGNVIQGNFIGLRPDGTVRGNFMDIAITGSTATIGGVNPADRNVISNADFGVVCNGGQATIQGNYIGTDPSGTQPQPNGAGIQVYTLDPSTQQHNVIGGVAAGAGNLISGNSGVGVIIDDFGNGSVVQGNLIGTDAAGTGALPNSFAGVFIEHSAFNNLVGGDDPRASNTIAFNGTGVVVTDGSSGNVVRKNSIFGNKGLGIDLGGDGVTSNDAQDADTGPNDFQNFPVLSSAVVTAGTTAVQGILNSLPNQPFLVDFYANDVADPSGFGEGQTWLGSVAVVTDAFGNASFNAPLPVALKTGQYVSATATTALTAPAGATSEFSADVPVQVTVPPPPPSPPVVPPPPPTISINDVKLKEGNSGLKDFNFTVALSAASAQPVTVHFKTQNGTASSASDYTAVDSALIIPAGDTTGTITVKVHGDTTHEADETFFLQLDSPTNATLADGSGTGTILNDDAAPPVKPSIRVNDESIFEGNSGTKVLTFTITLSSATTNTVKVSFTTSDGTAKASDHDYVSKSGVLTFAPGQTTKTVSITITGDKKKEADESFALLLSAPVNATIADAIGIGKIKNDD